MNSKLEIHRSPVVLLRNVFTFEVFFLLILFVFFFLRSIFLPDADGVDLGFRGLIAVLLIQLIGLVGFFVNWFLETYEIDEEKILHNRGILVKNKSVVKLKKDANFSIEENLLDRIFRSQTLELSGLAGEASFKLKNISKQSVKSILDALDSVKVIKQEEDLLNMSLENLLEQEENGQLELKETLRWDIHDKKVNKELEWGVIKNIAAFMNTNGGVLMIGVKDNKSIKGLDLDFDTLPKSNKDGFENHLNQLIGQFIGADHRGTIDIKFPEVKKQVVCQIIVRRAKEPIFLKNKDEEFFYIRTGNSATPLSVGATYKYCKDRFE